MQLEHRHFEVTAIYPQKHTPYIQERTVNRRGNEICRKVVKTGRSTNITRPQHLSRTFLQLTSGRCSVLDGPKKKRKQKKFKGVLGGQSCDSVRETPWVHRFVSSSCMPVVSKLARADVKFSVVIEIGVTIVVKSGILPLPLHVVALVPILP